MMDTLTMSQIALHEAEQERIRNKYDTVNQLQMMNSHPVEDTISAIGSSIAETCNCIGEFLKFGRP